MAYDQKLYDPTFAATAQAATPPWANTVMGDRNPDSFHAVAEQANSRMSDFLMTLAALTDQLCGGEPPRGEAHGGNVKSVPNGAFANAVDNCSQIMVKLDEANRLVGRIRNAL